MIDIQKLLIGVATQALGGGLRSISRPSRSRSSRGYGRSGSGLNEGKLLVGLLGVAVAAYEHYSKSSAGTGAAPVSGAIPPPPPRNLPGQSASRPQVPPPVPGSSMGASPVGASTLDPHALLLLRAMVASAYADGVLDEEERKSILAQLGGNSLSEEERQFLEKELSAPRTIQELAAGASSDEERKQIYAAAALAIEVDSQQEQTFLSQLAGALRIDARVREDLHAQLGIPLGAQ